MCLESKNRFFKSIFLHYLKFDDYTIIISLRFYMILLIYIKYIYIMYLNMRNSK